MTNDGSQSSVLGPSLLFCWQIELYTIKPKQKLNATTVIILLGHLKNEHSEKLQFIYCDSYTPFRYLHIKIFKRNTSLPKPIFGSRAPPCFHNIQQGVVFHGGLPLKQF